MHNADNVCFLGFLFVCLFSELIVNAFNWPTDLMLSNSRFDYSWKVDSCGYCSKLRLKYTETLIYTLKSTF